MSKEKTVKQETRLVLANGFKCHKSCQHQQKIPPFGLWCDHRTDEGCSLVGVAEIGFVDGKMKVFDGSVIEVEK